VNGVSAHDAVNYDDYSTWWIWWLEHGLDGIAGALIAVVGVGATLWYDRHARSRERVERDRDEVRKIVGQVLEKALDANSKLLARGGSPRSQAEALAALDREIRLATPHLYGAQVKELASSLQRLGAVIDLVIRPRLRREEAGQLAFSVVSRCQAWIRDPERYSNKTQDRGEEIAYGDTVVGGLLHPEAGGPRSDAEPSA
jgi:hypothetical protein